MKKHTMIKLLALAMSVLMIGSQLLACSFYGNNGYYGESDDESNDESDDERDVESDGSGNSEGENNSSNENSNSNSNGNNNNSNSSNNSNNSSSGSNNSSSNSSSSSNNSNNNSGSSSGGDEQNAENIVFTNRTTYLPDPDKFFNGELARYEDKVTKKGNLISYEFDLSGKDAATEYVAALLDSKFLLTRKTDTYDKFDDYGVGSLFYTYRFYYIGDGSVGTAHDIDIFTDESVDCSVFVSIINDFRDGSTLMSLYYADGFEFYDAGHRSSVKGLVDYSGNVPSSGTGGGSGSWNPLGDTCQYCNGRGTRACLTCDGKGYVEMWITVPNYSGHGSTGGYERHDCPNVLCRNGQVNCLFCGGTGRR